VLDTDPGEPGPDPLPRRIVGVVADAALQRLEANAVPLPAIYLPTRQVEMRATAFAVRAAGPIGPLGRAVREAVASVDASLPVGGLKTMERHVDEQLAGPRLIGYFAGGVGLVALILAALGIYGVMAHSVVQRTREIGIRMAMGAERPKVIGMITRAGLSLVAIGMLVGLPLAWVMSRATLSAIGDVTEVLPVWQVGAAVAGSLALVALVACVVPALRASAIRPARALARD
jgi:predicted lysophospholipase L1 biosynthesis ABC-type transport system permease subunit